MPHFVHDGIRFFYIDGPLDATDRPVVLLIHGMTCDVTDWSFQIPFLQGLGYRTIAIDSRGHGHSDTLVSPFTTWKNVDYRWAAMASDILALLVHLHIDQRIVLMTHSSGAVLASYLIVRHPDLVEAFIAIDPAYYFTQEHFGQIQILATSPHTIDPKLKTSHDGYDFAFRGGAYSKNAPAWLPTWHEIRRRSIPTDLLLRMHEQQFMNDPETGSWEKAIVGFTKEKRKPPRCVVVSGPENLEKELSLGVDEKDLLTMLQNGHWLHLENSEALNRIVKDWLGERGLLPSSP